MALTATDFNFPGQQGVYHGKVRDVYNMGDKLVMVATDPLPSKLQVQSSLSLSSQ